MNGSLGKRLGIHFFGERQDGVELRLGIGIAAAIERTGHPVLGKPLLGRQPRGGPTCFIDGVGGRKQTPASSRE